MSWIDWGILIVAVVALRFVSMSTRSYMKGVADFLSANRCAGRYLLTIASGMGNAGTVTFVAGFVMYYQNGFPAFWWGMMSLPIGVIILLTGWVFYRFRETRAMTMAQFFEMRYSRRFRIFAGMLCVACGVINFGIFPGVTAQFFIYFCGLPAHFHVPGVPFQVSTLAVVMALDLGIALLFVIMGGQISIMVTECAQGIFCSFAFLVVIATVLLKLQWPQIVQALGTAPASASLLHPYHTSRAQDFTIWYFLIAVFANFYTYMSWQGGQGFYSAARNPHEQRMGGIISIWRALPQALFTVLVAIAAFTVLKMPEFSAQAAAVGQALKTIPSETIREQMRVPILLAHFLPIGVKGLLLTTMLFFSFTCHDTYMHSWGSIFIQDVVMPIRNRPISPEQHIRLLRGSVIGVAVFAFFFSLYYPQTQKILFLFPITGTIWLGGSGIVIIGGLYWKHGTTAAAYAALIVGAVMGVGGLMANQIWMAAFDRKFPINGMVLYFCAMVTAIVVYIGVSLLTGRKQKDANFDKLLHRGKYSVAGEHKKPVEQLRSKWVEIVGIRQEFSFSDKLLAVALLVWNLGWFAVFLVVTAIHLIFGLSTQWWATFWHFWVLLTFLISVPATICLSIGGILDIRRLFRTLSTTVTNAADDGSVTPESDHPADPASASEETTALPARGAPPPAPEIAE